MPTAQENRLRKAEDILAYDLYLYLRGDAPREWRGYLDTQTGRFLRDAKSANHKAMAAALWLVLTGEQGAVRYWAGRFKRELEGGDFLQGEPRSDKYGVWSLASVALVWQWAEENRRPTLMRMAGRYYQAWCALHALGGVEEPARNLVGNRWSGCYVSGVGVRADPGQLEGDPRAWVLQTEVWPEEPLRDVYRENARERREMGEREKAKSSLEELRRRKQVSELWWLDAIQRARRAGLGLSPQERSYLRAWMARTPRPEPAAREWILKTLSHGCRYTFHFTFYGNGIRVSWLENALGERCVFGDRVEPDGVVVRVLFPYPEGSRLSRGGTCDREGGRLVARGPEGEDSLNLPDGRPELHLLYDSRGLREAMP
jgi:hypothetical protein